MAELQVGLNEMDAYEFHRRSCIAAAERWEQAAETQRTSGNLSLAFSCSQNVNPAMKRARTSGELARGAGKAITANPYRKDSSTRSPRRGSWSEAFARQWALGWREIDERLKTEPAPAVPGTDTKEVLTQGDPPTAPSRNVARQGIAST